MGNKIIALRFFLRKHKKAIICVLCLVIVLIRILAGPKTIASGNGYSHQIGSFGECDMKFDGCTSNATHRRHHLFENEDYCESCWDPYGQDMFDRLSNKKSSSSGIEYDEYKCRHSGCNKRAETSEWERRFCSEHLNGMKYCRYPHCDEQIPINGTSEYCWKHR